MSNNQELEERIDTLMRGILVESIGTPIAVDVFTGSEAKQALLRLIKDQQLALINKIEELIGEDNTGFELYGSLCTSDQHDIVEGRNQLRKEIKSALNKLKQEIE